MKDLELEPERPLICSFAKMDLNLQRKIISFHTFDSVLDAFILFFIFDLCCLNHPRVVTALHEKKQSQSREKNNCRV